MWRVKASVVSSFIYLFRNETVWAYVSSLAFWQPRLVSPEFARQGWIVTMWRVAHQVVTLAVSHQLQSDCVLREGLRSRFSFELAETVVPGSVFLLFLLLYCHLRLSASGSLLYSCLGVGPSRPGSDNIARSGNRTGSLVSSVVFSFTRFECSFNFTRFECSFNFTRFECSI